MRGHGEGLCKASLAGLSAPYGALPPRLGMPNSAEKTVQIILKVTCTPPMPSPATPENEATTRRCPVCACELIDRLPRHGLRAYLRSLLGRFPFRWRRCGQEFYLPQRIDQNV